jgi:hypothetical protein
VHILFRHLKQLLTRILEADDDMSLNSLRLIKIIKIISMTTYAILLSIITSTKLVFCRWPYLILGGAVMTIFWIIFNVFDQLLFFSPVVTFYLPEDAVGGFILSSVTAVFVGVIISMNLYVIKHSKRLKVGLLSLFSGSSLSVLSSTCASCSSLGFLLISTFGGLGVTASTFLTNYQMPLRVISILLLIWAYYSRSKRLTRSCILNYDLSTKKHI